MDKKGRPEQPAHPFESSVAVFKTPPLIEWLMGSRISHMSQKSSGFFQCDKTSELRAVSTRFYHSGIVNCMYQLHPVNNRVIVANTKIRMT